MAESGGQGGQREPSLSLKRGGVTRGQAASWSRVPSDVSGRACAGKLEVDFTHIQELILSDSHPLGSADAHIGDEIHPMRLTARFLSTQEGP